MPLYRKILRNSNFQNSRIHFVFDNEDAMNAEGYLEKFGIMNTQRTFEVNYVSFYENNINSTPTFILTDNKGTIIKQFVGTITAELEDNLLNINNANDSN
jgi:thioredoxin-related protein